MSLEMMEMLIYVVGGIGIAAGVVGIIAGIYYIYSVLTDSDNYEEVK